jgi:hypothetical protein
MALTNRLSDYILAGSKLKPQGFATFEGIPNGTSDGWTAAVEVAFPELINSSTDEQAKAFEQLLGYNPKGKMVKHPLYQGMRYVTVFRAIDNLCHNARWTREMVARWLDGEGL